MCCLLMSCDRPQIRSVYYWSTNLEIDSTKIDFLHRYDISRMYVRFFDVVADAYGRSIPNATLLFSDIVPSGIEVVPTVFVMPECLRGDHKELARNILRRVLQMCSTNDIHGVREIQIDCDWTVSTRLAYHDFMRVMLRECHANGLQLSSTIRLHQLAQTPPPADRGVLMVYNTGDVTDMKCRQPILDMRDAAPYMRYLSDYKLPLSAAYPIFSWRVLTRGGSFVGIVHYDGEYPMLPGDSILIHEPQVSDIVEAEHVVDSRRPEANSEIILFDLNNKNIKRINTDGYEKIFGL